VSYSIFFEWGLEFVRVEPHNRDDPSPDFRIKCYVKMTDYVLVISIKVHCRLHRCWIIIQGLFIGGGHMMVQGWGSPVLFNWYQLKPNEVNVEGQSVPIQAISVQSIPIHGVLKEFLARLWSGTTWCHVTSARCHSKTTTLTPKIEHLKPLMRLPSPSIPSIKVLDGLLIELFQSKDMSYLYYPKSRDFCLITPQPDIQQTWELEGHYERVRTTV
jgi:hypothetical protein